MQIHLFIYNYSTTCKVCICVLHLKHARLGDCIKLEALKFAKTKTLEGLSFHWYREGEDTELVTLAKPNVLKIQSVTEEDFGQYKCEIKKEGIPYITTYLGLLKQSEGKISWCR